MKVNSLEFLYVLYSVSHLVSRTHEVCIYWYRHNYFEIWEYTLIVLFGKMETCGYKNLFCGVKTTLFWLNNVLFVLSLISNSTGAILVGKEDLNKGDNITKVENWNLAALSEVQENSFKTIIQEVDKLKILQNYEIGKGCFSLRNVRKTESITETSQKYIEISFTFEEMEINPDRLLALQVETSGTHDHIIVGNGNLVSDGCKGRPALIESKGLNKMSRKQSEKIPSFIKTESNSGNMTDTSDKLPVSGEDKNNSDKEKGIVRQKCSFCINKQHVTVHCLKHGRHKTALLIK